MSLEVESGEYVATFLSFRNSLGLMLFRIDSVIKLISQFLKENNLTNTLKALQVNSAYQTRLHCEISQAARTNAILCGSNRAASCAGGVAGHHEHGRRH